MIENVFHWGSVWARQEEPGNHTHIIPVPKNYSLLAQFHTSLKFRVQENCTWLLVVNTVSMFSTVSNLASKHFHSPCFLLYTTLGEQALSLTMVPLAAHTTYDHPYPTLTNLNAFWVVIGM